MRSPQLTPEVFEAFLPYAFALGVENAWVERFEREFPQQDPERGGYQPAWYHGDLGRATSLNHIGQSLGSDQIYGLALDRKNSQILWIASGVSPRCRHSRRASGS